MSVEAMTWALRTKTGSVSRKAVLLALADKAGFDWKCWPSQATIAAHVELSERQVRRVMGELEERGFLHRQRRIDAKGHRTSDLITLIPTGQYVRLVATDLPDIHESLPDTQGHPYRTPMSGEPSEEPPEVEPLRKRARNELWDALEAEMGPAETRTAQSLRGKTVRDLKEVGATPEEIHKRCKVYHRKFKGCDLTETALLKHWSRLNGSKRDEDYYDPDTGAWMSAETRPNWR